MRREFTARSTDLALLAYKPFGYLTEAEKKLVSSAASGTIAMCGPIHVPKGSEDDPADPANSAYWSPGRSIRAELIRWLCVNPEAVRLVDPRGIQITFARITDKLDLSVVRIPFPLILRRCLLPEIDLSNVTIPVLLLGGSSTQAISLRGANVKDDIHLNRGFSVSGGASLNDATIGGDLICADGHFGGTSNPGLDLGGIKVGGSVLLNEGFRSNGVNMARAQIGGELSCVNGQFGRGIALTEAVVKGFFVWQRATHGGFVDLTNTTVGVLLDDKQSWPIKSGVGLNGFVYGRLLGPTDPTFRLRWLASNELFSPQPYLQFAKTLRDLGNETGVKQVLVEMERRKWGEHEKNSPPQIRLRLSCEETLLKAVGYGYSPGNAIWYLLGLNALGWVVYRRAKLARAMAPTDKDAYTEFRKSGVAPDYYPPFSPLIYTIENSVPLVNLGQDDHWQPDPNPPRSVLPTETSANKLPRLKYFLAHLQAHVTSPATLRAFRFLLIVAGFVLAWFLTKFFFDSLTLPTI
jgi:hypothetical protein